MHIKLLALAALIPAAGVSQGAVLSAFDFEANPSGVWYQEAHVNTSAITANGGLVRASSPNNISGWDVSPSINVNSGKSVTFEVSVDDGYQMSLTSFFYMTSRIGGAGPTRLTLGAWGYRVDNGNGYGEWTLSEFALGPNGSSATWTFAEPVLVTDTIQFGFFAAGATQAGGLVNVTGGRTGDDMIVSGTISAVPEPSSLLLGAVGSLAFFRRRRA